MKKIVFSLFALVVGLAVKAQTLNVVCGDVTYAVPAEQADDMVYTDGDSVTIMNRTFALSDVARMYIDSTSVVDNLVTVTYADSSAKVWMSGNIAQYVTAVVDGANVSIVQGEQVDSATCGEIVYSLSGSSAKGSFLMTGSYKATVELNGLSLTNPQGAALDIQNGKRIELKVQDGTTNTLVDCAGGSQKGCLTCKGHLEFKGRGVLNVYGNTNHAIHAKEYVEMKHCTINVVSAVKDGINCNQYMLLTSGELNISGVGDDGVQVSYKDETNREAEDTGTLTITGGTVNVVSTVAKGLKAYGNVDIAGGTINVTASGPTGEGIESKEVMTVSGGTIVVNSYDDGFNAGSHLYIKGGDITVIANHNDALDSNGNLYMSGGVVRCFGGPVPETGIDANTERGYTVYFTGGTLLAVGSAGNSAPTNSTSTQPYVTASGSLTANAEVILSDGTTTLAKFTVPSNYTAPTMGGGRGMEAPPRGMGARPRDMEARPRDMRARPRGMDGPPEGMGVPPWGMEARSRGIGDATRGPGGPGGPGGFGPGGSSAGTIVVTCPGLTTGTTYTLTLGTTTTNVQAVQYGSGGGHW